MQEIKLKLDARSVSGKNVAKIRREGFVPSVVYGHGNDPVNMQSDELDTIKVVRAAGKHAPIGLTIDGKKQLAIIKTLDFDPIKHKLRHIAFQAISQNEEVTTEVAIHLDGEGESAAERAGLVVLQAIERVEIKAKPANLPEALHISIVDLASTEDKLTFADIKLPEGVEFADNELDLDLVVANVYEPGALQAANEAAAGDAEDVSDVETENGTAETPEEGDKKEEKSE